MNPIASEHQHQAALVKWAKLSETHFPELKLLVAIPNGGHRDLRVARKLKAEGVRRGVPDLFLPVARRGYHGCFIELKNEKGRTTPEQNDFICHLREQGYLAHVAVGWESGKRLIEWYLGQNDVGAVQ